MERSPRWHDVVIGLWITGLLVAGIAAMWGSSLRALWAEDAETAPEKTTSGAAGANL